MSQEEEYELQQKYLTLKFIKDIGLVETGRIIKNSGNKERRRRFLVECICGKQTTIDAAAYKINPPKHCKSCASRIKATKHNKCFTPIYTVWYSMKTRCYNKNNKDYKRYGERGILICKEWKDDFLTFENWAINNGYRNGLTIDRINNNKSYTPTNCRWVNRTVQARNTRRLNSRNTSGYRGVYFDKRKNKFLSKITVNYKVIDLGKFDTALAAAKVRDKYVIDNNLLHTLNDINEKENR